MLKHILIASAISSFSSASIVPFINSNNINEEENFIEFLRKDIEENKFYLGKQVYSEYDGKIFTSQESLNEYILSNSIVQSEFTSSNPSKIIKDYEHMTLDETKIYDIDMDKFLPVYRDAFGNIAQTSQKALDIYTHGGLVRQKYSYDEEEWFDSPEEAKINQKDKMKINKSLYYIHNNKYYNAFNLKDINNLLNTFEEGYFVNKTKSLEGNQLLQPIIEYGNKDILYKKMKRELKENFFDSYFYEISDMDYQNKLSFEIKDKNELRIAYPGRSQEIYYSGSRPQITFANKYSSTKDMIDDFKNIVKWSEGVESGGAGIGRYYWYRDFDLIENSNKVTATVKLLPKWSAGFGKNKPSFDHYTYTNKTVSKINTYYDKSKQQLVDSVGEFSKRYSIQESTREDKSIMYDSWFDEYFQKNITSFPGNENKLVRYEDILQENFIKNSDQSVYKDLLYDVNYAKGTAYSLIKSYYDWQRVKNDLLNNPVTVNEEIMYQLRPDFYATKEQLDSFIALQGKFNAVLKYSYGSNADLSSPDGKLLANTYEEAREKQFANANLSLKKRYIAYDVFENAIESGNSEQEAIRELQNNILLESKMVHKKEIENWNWDVKKSYDSIISDGRYLVYKVKAPKSNNYIYYSSQEMALKAALSNARISGDVNKMSLEKYVYTYTDSFTQKEYSVIFYNNDIDSAIQKILLEIESIKKILH
ncbi:hypothetical protein [Spiroplasma floricola]|uniref:Uncharacterized protein n=1 Tax=Spiroplasma floricola 23-6 TaxID=1336749 RepID=A0A2K8SDT2_9MOLU|nr:hypothetical protein [Spiroplasma floricola]AUB31617.1 hypothetical protein SFLOR_v1c05650 [Spiroplasma floricola 23-6]